MEREINRPRFYWALPNEELPDGFGNLMASPMEIVVDGYQPCDACGQIEYTEETACSQLIGVWGRGVGPGRATGCGS